MAKLSIELNVRFTFGLWPKNKEMNIVNDINISQIMRLIKFPNVRKLIRQFNNKQSNPLDHFYFYWQLTNAIHLIKNQMISNRSSHQFPYQMKYQINLYIKYQVNKTVTANSSVYLGICQNIFFYELSISLQIFCAIQHQLYPINIHIVLVNYYFRKFMKQRINTEQSCQVTKITALQNLNSNSNFNAKKQTTEPKCKTPLMKHENKIIGQHKNQYKQAIFKNVQKLVFRPHQCFGAIQITQNEISVPILTHNNTHIIVGAELGKGRALAIGHQHIFKDFMVYDDQWIIFMRNIIDWITKNKYSQKQYPLKILMISSSPNQELELSLSRASTFISVDYESQFQGIDLSRQYDCIFIHELKKEIFNDQDCKKVLKFVENGGGLLIGLRGWVFKNYGEGAKYKNWVSECYHNNIILGLGMCFTQKYTHLEELNLKPKQTIKLKQNLERLYTKQLNPLFIEKDQSKMKELLKQDKKQLLKDVEEWVFDKGIAPGKFVLSSDNFISVFRHQQKDFSASGRYGKGKIFLFGHTDLYQNKTAQQGPNKKFLQNIISWMCGSKPKIMMGLLHEKGWDGQFSFKKTNKNVQSKYVNKIEDLHGVDILCVTYYSKYPNTMTSQFNKKIQQYVQKGGNLIFVAFGWVWINYGEYKENNSLVFEKDFANYVLLKNFGVELSSDCVYRMKNFTLQNNIQDSNDKVIENFLKNDLLKALKDKNKQNFDTDEAQLNKFLQKISSTNSNQHQSIFSINLYHQLVDAFIDSRFNIDKNYDTLSFSNTFTCNIFKFMNAISYAVPPHVCRALPPSLNKYPGIATNKLIEKVVEVYVNKNKIVFTGLYINPGEVVRIRHKNLLSELKGVQLKVNFNRDLSGYDNGKLKRFTNIAKNYVIKENQFLIASPHGGIIYFEVAKGASNKPLVFLFQGAYQAPYWNESIHSYDDFQKIKKINAPFFVIETKRINLIGRTKKLFSSINIKIQKLSKWWNEVIGHIKNYRGAEQYPFEKDAIFNDANLTRGYMHSNNPVMTHEDVTFEMLGIGGKLFVDANWGFYHEFGHNHQDYKWTVPYTVEVTCNIFSLYMINKMHNKSIESYMFEDSKKQQQLKKYLQAPTIQAYKKDPFLGLILYAVIMEQFGYEIFSQIHKRYNNIDLSTQASPEAKFDVLVQQISVLTGYNFWHYFKKWQMPVSQNSLLKVKKLKKYVCKRFPFITQN